MAQHQVTHAEKTEKTTKPETPVTKLGLRRTEEFPSILTKGMFGLSPFGMVRRLMDDMDRMFGSIGGFGLELPTMLSPLGLAPIERIAETVWTPPIEAFERNGKLVYRVDLPGLEQKDIHVAIDGEDLVISGERAQDREDTKGGRHYSERRYGSFERRFTLPPGCDLEAIEATFDNGVLEVSTTAPKGLPPRGRTIEIKTPKPKEPCGEEAETKSVH